MGIKGLPLQHSSSATSIRSRHLETKMKAVLILLACIVAVESYGGSLGCCVGYSGYGTNGGYGGYGGYICPPCWWYGVGYRPWGGLFGRGGYSKFHKKY